LLGAVHKRRPQEFVQCGQGGGGISSDADVRTFGAKNFGFFKINVVRTGKRFEPMQTYFGQGGSIFFDFVRTFFIDGSFTQTRGDWKLKAFTVFGQK